MNSRIFSATHARRISSPSASPPKEATAKALGTGFSAGLYPRQNRRHARCQRQAHARLPGARRGTMPQSRHQRQSHQHCRRGRSRSGICRLALRVGGLARDTRPTHYRRRVSRANPPPLRVRGPHRTRVGKRKPFALHQSCPHCAMQCRWPRTAWHSGLVSIPMFASTVRSPERLRCP